MVFDDDERLSISGSDTSSNSTLARKRLASSPDIYSDGYDNACRQVFVKGLQGRTLVFHFEVPPRSWEFVDRVADEVGLPADRLSLFFRGRRLNSTNMGLPNNATIHATINAYSPSSDDEDDDETGWYSFYEENPSLRWYDADELSSLRQARYASHLKSMWTKRRPKH
ncbi:hypothetical protein NA57DRAFT_80869 [Rhizodiscina lignyota]|uniref:Ubiquitin-like domain-containing protein n=1 Tax=Rhizodiscina lignyota TaxID=1504668 RepID=A0A9P4I4V9_9PEZI|nr:hypothetical protein NA57DRAFT_80869 [Rhizodiscina lignyota]